MKETPEQKIAKATIKEKPLEMLSHAIKQLSYSQLLKIEEEVLKQKKSLKAIEEERLEKEITTLSKKLEELRKQ